MKIDEILRECLPELLKGISDLALQVVEDKDADVKDFSVVFT